MKEFKPVTEVPQGFVPVDGVESEKLIRANHPRHKRWHLLRFDLNGFDHCNVFVEETGELILITTPQGHFVSPVMFSKLPGEVPKHFVPLPSRNCSLTAAHTS